MPRTVLILILAFTGLTRATAVEGLADRAEVYAFEHRDGEIRWTLRLRDPGAPRRASRLACKPVDPALGAEVRLLEIPAPNEYGLAAWRTKIDARWAEGCYEVEWASGESAPGQPLGVLVVKNRGRFVNFIPHDPESSAFPPALRFDEAERERQRERGRGLLRDLLKALEEKRGKFTIPPGHYRLPLDPENANQRAWTRGLPCHLYFGAVKNFELEGYGATIWFEAFEFGFVFQDCEGVTVKGLAFDYDPLPFIQGRIVGIDDERKRVRFTVDPGYMRSFEALDAAREEGIHLHYQAFEPDARKGRGIKRYWVAGRVYGERILAQEEGVFETGFHSRFANVSDSGLAVGDAFVFAARDRGDVFRFNRCGRMKLKDVEIYAAGNISVVDMYPTARNVYEGLRVARRPNTRRLIGDNSDGMHFKWCREGPHITGCTIEACMDDGISMSGIMPLVLEPRGERTLLVGARNTFPLNFGKDSVVEFFSYAALTPHGRARVTALERVEDPELAKRYNAAYLKKMGILPFSIQPFFFVTFDAPVQAQAGDMIFCADRCAATGFRFDDNFIYGTWARAMRVTGVDGSICGNTLENAGGLLLTPSLEWMNGTFPRRVKVAGNRIVGTRLHQVPLAISSGRTGRTSQDGEYLSEIRIEDNVVEDASYCGILAGDIAGLTLRNNRILRCNTRLHEPADEGGLDLNFGIVVHNATGVEAGGNAMEQPGPFAKGLGVDP
ncbi:MAG: hypothetical protein M5U26_20830 [Planctomycetota bacterium]|nr:hypothetical protein [Planctomycetota bacterium]